MTFATYNGLYVKCTAKGTCGADVVLCRGGAGTRTVRQLQVGCGVGAWVSLGVVSSWILSISLCFLIATV